MDFDKRSAFNATAILRVSEVWKGPEQETLEVNTRDPAFCGYPFKEGQEYLVYAQGGQDRLMVKNCGRTRPLSKAGADLAVLGNGQRLGDDEFLPDTSGGVAGLGVVALATVAAATAGLFLLKRHLKTR